MELGRPSHWTKVVSSEAGEIFTLGMNSSTTVSLGRKASKIQRMETHPTACSTAQIGSAAGKNGNALLFKEVVHVPQTLPLFFNSLEVSASRPTSNPSDIL